MRRALAAATLILAACTPRSNPEGDMMPAPQTPSESRKLSRLNRLAQEKSPYLQQHADNPVDWFPWSDEAFEQARRDDKPVFLSIGYSTCHWCHVMEHESFESEEIARVLNEHFVSIKVDREERPDVDQVYMAAVVAMTGHGGWPLSAFLTPDRRPFLTGTYWPPDHFRTILLRVAELWKSERAKLVEASRAIINVLESPPGGGPPGVLENMLKEAVEDFALRFDEEYGGFGPAPKFPRTVALEFLLRVHARGAGTVLKMVRAQLDGMMRGGLYDHLGGGFHRYSTDERWLVPHFEKMLYDQAYLVRVYLQAWQITRNPDYERVIRETCDYVLRDMTSPEGAFYSAEDADSEGVEGKFYVWTPEQVKSVVPGRDGELLCRAFGVVAGGNWEPHPHDQHAPRGVSVLHVAADAETLARDLKLSVKEVRAKLAEGRRRLFEARTKRPRPHRDEKVLTEWNAMMIGALARAGAIMEEPRYVAAAERTARFLQDKLRRADGRYLRRHRDGDARVPAFLDDYAHVSDALTDLYEATFRVEWLEEAVRAAEQMIERFGDAAGGFRFVGKDAEAPVAQVRDLYDGALPSGSAVAIHALLRLGEFTGRESLRRAARAALDRYSGEIARHPASSPHMLSALEASRAPWTEIAAAGRSEELLRAVRRRFLPNAILAAVPGEGPPPEAVLLAPFLEGKTARDGRAAVYVCRNYACQAPVTTLEQLEKVLDAR